MSNSSKLFRRLVTPVVGALAAYGASEAVAATATPASTAQPVTFSVFLPVQNRAGLQSLLADQVNPTSSSYHKWLTPDQFNTRFGPSASAVASVVASLKAQGFTVLSTSGRAVQVSGTASQVTRAFSTTLMNVQSSTGAAKLVASSSLQLPAPLKSAGAVVPAFSGPPRMHTHAKMVSPLNLADPANRASPSGGYFFDDLKQAYGYPSYQAYDGTGASVAVLISSDALDSDIDAVFNAGPRGYRTRSGPIQENFTGLTGKPAPTIIHQPVDQPRPTITSGLDEASLDVQEVLGGAPGAKVTLVDVPDLSDQSLLDGYSFIVNATKPTGGAQFQLVNSSFGECELFYTAAYNGGVDATYILDAYQQLFEQGNAEGITFVASSGDSGGLSCPDVNYLSSFYGKQPSAPARFLPGVEFPASSPNVTAVGGGNLVTSYAPPSLNSSYAAENANGDPELPYDPYGVGANVAGGYWGAGGGTSSIFAKPSYQNLVNTAATTRTVPDVGMQVGGCPGGIAITPCGPNRSYVIVAIQAGQAGGGFFGLIGTSVSSPEFVGALALYVQKTGGGVGNVNPYLYAKGAAQTAGAGTGYRRYVPGFDGRYTDKFPAGGYNYLIGNGTPQVAALFGLGTTLAGTPQTVGNP